MRSIEIPVFKTESEEANWWDANPDIATELMSKALKAGTARRKVPTHSALEKDVS